jgi:hypothetical protein
MSTPEHPVFAAVKSIMAAHPPLCPPLTAKRINARLPPELRRSEGDIRHHMREVRREAAVDATSIPSSSLPIAS